MKVRDYANWDPYNVSMPNPKLLGYTPIYDAFMGNSSQVRGHGVCFCFMLCFDCVYLEPVPLSLKRPFSAVDRYTRSRSSPSPSFVLPLARRPFQLDEFLLTEMDRIVTRLAELEQEINDILDLGEYGYFDIWRFCPGNNGGGETLVFPTIIADQLAVRSRRV